MDGDKRAHAGAGGSHHTANGDSKVIGDTRLITIALVTETRTAAPAVVTIGVVTETAPTSPAVVTTAAMVTIPDFLGAADTIGNGDRPGAGQNCRSHHWQWCLFVATRQAELSP